MFKAQVVVGSLLLITTLFSAGCGSVTAQSPVPSTSGSASSLPATVPPPESSPRSSPRASPVSRPSASASASASPSLNWLSYHANQARTGYVASGPSHSPLQQAWSVDLGGAVRGQPLVVDGRVIAATETNRVSALDSRTGAVLWSTSLGAPLTDVAAVAGCGDIDPLGVTSTPVVDPATRTVYLVAQVSDQGGSVHHQLEGLDVLSGKVRLSENVDPPLPAGESAVNLLQRASLALGSGRVYIAYGGNDGDCGSYHGWVVGVQETGPPQEVAFEVAADGEGGAVWEAGGAPALDADGNLFISTGNANPDPPGGGPDPKSYTESVVKLTPDLHPTAAFKDTVAGGDEDLATGNPVLLPDGNLFAVGKTDIGYVLRQDNLREVAAIPGICGSDPDGGPAYDAATNRMFVPCRDGGIQIVDLGSSTLGPRLSGADSAPIIVGGSVWAVDHAKGILTEYATTDGRTQQSIQMASTIPIFTSPSVGSGLLLVASTTGVSAFR